MAADERASYRVTSSYHTGYVWGFVCASMLVPGRTPPAVPQRTVGVRPGAGDALLELVAERPAPWVQRALSLAPPQRDALAPLVLNMVLRRATQTGNIALIRSALERGARWAALGGSAPKQAASLLRRAADLSLSITTSVTGTACRPKQDTHIHHGTVTGSGL